MKITMTTTRDTAVYELADAVASASPDEFAAFFLRLSERLLNEHERMMAFAQVMADSHGSNRNRVLRELLQRITYFEGKEKWEPVAQSEESDE